MNQEQIDVLNITQQVLRAVMVSVGALNPAAMQNVGVALRAASMHEDLEPMSRRMLGDLAGGVEMLTGKGAPGH